MVPGELIQYVGMIHLKLLLSSLLLVTPPTWGTAFPEKEFSQDWRIGGKIHFEVVSADDYIGITEINSITRNEVKTYFPVYRDLCDFQAKLLLKKEGDHILLTHREERSKPGIGEELHATLLYTSRRVEGGHETLRDIYDNLRQVDPTLPQHEAPSVEQVAAAYQKAIKPDFQFSISDVQLITNSTGHFIVLHLQLNGKDEICNDQRNPISGSFLHMTLLVIDPTVTPTTHQISSIVDKLRRVFVGKKVKIADRNGYADLEFGLSGSADRIRPKCEGS